MFFCDIQVLLSDGDNPEVLTILGEVALILDEVKEASEVKKTLNLMNIKGREGKGRENKERKGKERKGKKRKEM